jgi:hypothetical protein
MSPAAALTFVKFFKSFLLQTIIVIYIAKDAKLSYA